MKKIKIIGLTGQSGAGKSTVSAYFLNRNINVINADMLVRELYEDGSPCVSAIASAFGVDVLDDNGNIIRRKLAQRAFASKENTQLLNSLVHPFVMSMFFKKAKQIAQNGGKYIVYDAPQLFESNADIICDTIISVVAEKNIRINRICKRDNIDKNEVYMRLNVQFDEDFFMRNSDYLIENNSDLESLEKQIEDVYNSICKR